MLLQAVKTQVVLWIVLIASVTALPLVPRTTQEPEVVARATDTTLGKCLNTSTLIYVETVRVLKDNSSLINGTIEIFIGEPIIIDCVRIVAKTEHDRLALKEHKLSGTNTIKFSVAEQQPSQSKPLEYSVYVYATITEN